MASCTNCGNTGFTTTSTGSVIFTGSELPGSQFGFFSTYPTTCPGGCLYMTSSGFRCSNSTVGTCPNNRGCNNCGCAGCGGCAGCSGIMPFSSR